MCALEANCRLDCTMALAASKRLQLRDWWKQAKFWCCTHCIATGVNEQAVKPDCKAPAGCDAKVYACKEMPSPLASRLATISAAHAFPMSVLNFPAVDAKNSLRSIPCAASYSEACRIISSCTAQGALLVQVLSRAPAHSGLHIDLTPLHGKPLSIGTDCDRCSIFGSRRSVSDVHRVEPWQQQSFCAPCQSP